MCKLGNVGHAPTGEIRCSEIDSESILIWREAKPHVQYLHGPQCIAIQFWLPYRAHMDVWLHTIQETGGSDYV